jgi:hypothetical protein
MTAKQDLYIVRYTNTEGQTRQANVRGFTASEAKAKARKYIMNGGEITYLRNTGA